jgi:uncharacterized membrane protein
MKILKKFTSRKFWAGMAGVIAPILVLLKMPESEIVTVTALITACGTLVAYIFAEASIDIENKTNSNENEKDDENV